MCGITGAKNRETVKALNQHLSHRGSSCETVEIENFAIGHYLHSVVGELSQPIEDKGLLSANCEIYNWKELNEKYGWETENDAETLLKLLDEKGVEGLEEVDGIYAFAYLKDGEIIIARDVLGVNPVWYSDEEFVFASERQALEKEGLECRELHPRRILRYDIEEDEVSFQQREFFEIDVKEAIEIDQAAEEIKEKFLGAVKKRVPEGDVGLLFSGGVDSTLIAAALQELDKGFTAYTAGIQHGNVNAPRDMDWAQEIAEEMDIELEAYEASLEEVEEVLPEIVDWISSTSVVKNGVALPFHFALQKNQDNEQVVFSGLGSEQLYAGYHRQQGYLNKECLSGLRGIFERDLYRDNVISFRNGRELRLPFLDHDLIEHALTIPEEYKVKDDYRKYVLRKAAEKLGVPEKVAWRGKTAAQYGSNFDKAIDRLSRDKGFDHKQEYLNSLRESENRGFSGSQKISDLQRKPNNRVVALTSGGKDSNAALYRIQRRNNKISCLLTLRSENKDSYMFDSKKSRGHLDEQSEKLGIPLLVQETEGEKEVELEDLRKGLEKAREEYNVEGVVAGALASTYQRDRVDKLADRVGLKVFTPLWQEDQARYMKWLIREGFKVEITSVAARGLTEEWEGEVLDEENIEELLDLADEYRFNAAGEGGEYETRVVGFPVSLKG
ncbi:diphthine--ammonia ligase [Candidatus Nanohalovita haloferacivicina]|uniref:diphthine--ammonia ligase n=1 Tax=Candidatus Nanohalovita haloferacivicina TaxID=2978046 RepID=UPI00325FD1A3|nr:Asparagine synthase (glutamine-hydrolyzing) [Candidatus Nanohalobia archaeon BNXNv]